MPRVYKVEDSSESTEGNASLHLLTNPTGAIFKYPRRTPPYYIFDTLLVKNQLPGLVHNYSNLGEREPWQMALGQQSHILAPDR